MSQAATPRLSATVLLVRDAAGGLEVFMVERHRQIEFAPGALVFPGGSVDAADYAIAADATRCGGAARLDERARALRVAAVRETFEECGVLLARPRGSADWIDGARCAALAAERDRRSFGELVVAEDLELALDALTPFAHWITPTALPKRFDTHFYIVAAPADQAARHDGFESVDSAWVRPVRALEETAAGKHTLVIATRLNLQMLAERNDVAGALAAARERRVVTVEPVMRTDEAGTTVRIPIEAGYGGDVFPM